MVAISDKHKEMLGSLPFLEYLQAVKVEVGRIPFNNDAYWICRFYMHDLIMRFLKEYDLTSQDYHRTDLGNMLRVSEVGLEDYHKYDKTTQAKEKTIGDFKSDMDADLTRLILDIQTKNSR